MNAAPVQIQSGGKFPLAMVWVANLFAWIFTHVMAPLFTHLDEVKTLVEILAWGLTGAFTIWQWRSAAKKNRRR